VETPSYHDELPQDPVAAQAEAIRRVDEISAWFREYQVAAPILRVVRLKAVWELQKEYSIPEIGKLTNVAESRVREILKSSRARQRKGRAKPGEMVDLD
jgi:hypothetical protein